MANETNDKFTQYSAKNWEEADAQFYEKYGKHITKVATFQQWKKIHGRTVKKGEHGVKMYLPCYKKGNNGKSILDPKQEATPDFYKTFTVFDISQTEVITTSD